MSQENIDITAQNIPIPIGPYTQALDTGCIIFISGQIPIIPHTLLIPDNVYDQTYQALQNIRNIIESKQLTMNNIVKTTLFITNINDLSTINTSYKKFFEKYADLQKLNLPARSCIEVSRLPNDVKIEIESIAVRFNKKI